MWTDANSAQITGHVTQVRDWAPAVFTTIVSVVGGVGSVIAVAKTSADLLENRSLLAKRNSELEQAGKLTDLLNKFSNERLCREHQDSLAQAAQICLQECLANVEKLNARLVAIRLDPNSSLRVYEKLFLAFRPADWRGWVLHLLAYASVVGSGWYIFHSGVAQDTGTFSRETFLSAWQRSFAYLMLAFFLSVVLLFRAWALEERRRALGFHKVASPLERRLLMRFPENWRMLLGQIMFFLSSMVLLTVMHSSFTGVFGKGGDALFLLVFFGAPTLVAVLVFRAWALAELALQEQTPQLVSWRKALFAGFFKNMRRYGRWRLMFFLTLLWCLVFFVAMAFSALLIVGTQQDWLLALAFVAFNLPNLVGLYAVLRCSRIKCSLAAQALPRNDAAAAVSA